ncbi:anti-sigma factor family protein [Kitasatospora paracochleata]|uniref:Anti-sigma factor RsiW n=1 Tax=Kitasatospora paracochleata TaxID=58354 RepID=A0ABT1J6V0_9ACTN|nr:zf-HC2 domain-containing protein [Kitasatospora paracochleata]MCP2313163.1 anti-sigma factor RsiW [Kitasatospora paracochleata]
MTPHPPSSDRQPDDHPDIDVLADLTEDLLPAERAAEVRAHLADCPDCAETHAALAEVSRLLGDTEPPAMPEDIAARIDAALAAESAARAAVTPAPERPATTPGPRASRPTPPPPGRPKEAARPGGSTRPAPAGGPGRSRRRSATQLLLVTAVLAGVLTLGSVLLFQGTHGGGSTAVTADAGHSAPALAPGTGSGAGKSTGAPSSRLPATASLQEFREDTLAAQVHTLLATRPSPGIAVENPSDGRPANQAPPACVTAATGHADRLPLATATGRYGTTPVTALVYPSAEGTGRVDVYLVTPDCPGATVLLQRTVSDH